MAIAWQAARVWSDIAKQFAEANGRVACSSSSFFDKSLKYKRCVIMLTIMQFITEHE